MGLTLWAAMPKTHNPWARNAPRWRPSTGPDLTCVPPESESRPRGCEAAGARVAEDVRLGFVICSAHVFAGSNLCAA
jgi:hypothetical protein